MKDHPGAAIKLKLAYSAGSQYQMRTMKTLLLTLTLAAFTCVTALQAEEKKCEQSCDAKAKATACDKVCDAKAKSTCCEKEAFTRKITRTPKSIELAKK